MNTNLDAFENDLRALNRRALPEEWRNEMLQRSKPTMRTPRWLVAGWSMAWAAMVSAIAQSIGFSQFAISLPMISSM